MAGFRTFATGEVLTAANVNNFLMKQSVMVFADAAARTAALGAEVVEGMLTYNLDTGSLEVFDGAAFGPVVTAKEKRVDRFTGSGTFTVPAGVTYAIAYVLGGGGGLSGANAIDNSTAGVASSVAFTGLTVTSPGGARSNSRGANPTFAGGANTGEGGSGFEVNNPSQTNQAPSAVYVVGGAAVTPAEDITVTVGAGGTPGTGSGNGGTGYVYIEYFEEV